MRDVVRPIWENGDTRHLNLDNSDEVNVQFWQTQINIELNQPEIFWLDFPEKLA